jgi:hypothetical protein
MKAFHVASAPMDAPNPLSWYTGKRTRCDMKKLEKNCTVAAKLTSIAAFTFELSTILLKFEKVANFLFGDCRTPPFPKFRKGIWNLKIQ